MAFLSNHDAVPCKTLPLKVRHAFVACVRLLHCMPAIPATTYHLALQWRKSGKERECSPRQEPILTCRCRLLLEVAADRSAITETTITTINKKQNKKGTNSRTVEKKSVCAVRSVEILCHTSRYSRLFDMSMPSCLAASQAYLTYAATSCAPDGTVTPLSCLCPSDRRARLTAGQSTDPVNGHCTPRKRGQLPETAPAEEHGKRPWHSSGQSAALRSCVSQLIVRSWWILASFHSPLNTLGRSGFFAGHGGEFHGIDTATGPSTCYWGYKRDVVT